MTLKLVSNVEKLPVCNLDHLVSGAKELARRLEDGEYGEVISVITVIAKTDGLGVYTFGSKRNGYEMMGLLDSAKFSIFVSD
jgi:hypothetical protein